MRNMVLILMGLVLLGMCGLQGCSSAGYAKDDYEEIRKKQVIVDAQSAFAYMKGPQFRGDKILFYGYDKRGTFDIFIMDKDGGNLINLTNTPDTEEYLAYWTDDGKIVYITGPWWKGEEGWIEEEKRSWYIIGSDGKNKQKISKDMYRKLAIGYKKETE